MINKICLIANIYAANGKLIHAAVKNVDAFLKESGSNYEIIESNDIPHAQNAALLAADRGETIFVLGGDGSFRVIAKVLQYTPAVVAMVPCGRGNDFARMLNVPLNPVAACAALINGTVKTVDMAAVNNEPFINVCSLGFDSVANEYANKLSFIQGRAVYVYSGLIAVLRSKPVLYHLEIDGVAIEHIGHTVSFANAKYYGGGMKIAPNASITDGYLDVILVGNLKKSRLLYNMPKIFKGTHIFEPGIQIVRAKKVRINTDAKLTFFADGDAVAEPPGIIEVHPKALHVLVPKGTVL